jgi:hypothetical protein
MENRREFSDDQFQAHFSRRYGMTGRPYEFYQAGYQYGWEMAHDEGLEGRSWSLSEGYLRRDWSKRYPHRSWDDLRDAIREGWRSVRGE